MTFDICQHNKRNTLNLAFKTIIALHYIKINNNFKMQDRNAKTDVC